MRRGRKLLPSTKHKISVALSGMKNPFYGRHLSEAHKEKISESLKKYWEKKKKKS